MKLVVLGNKKILIANLTPHDLNLLIDDEVSTIPKSNLTLRVKEDIKVIGYKDSIKLVKKVLDDSEIDYKTLEELKKYAKTCQFVIVSLPCKDLLLNLYKKGLLSKLELSRFYVIGETIRDNDGKVLYAESLTPIIEFL